MASYSIADFIGKTITVKNEVPAYKRPTIKGEAKQKPMFFLDGGESFVVDTYVTKTGTYLNFDADYIIAAKTSKYPKGFAIKLADLSNNVDKSSFKTQNILSDKEKESSKEPFIQKITKQYLPYILGGIAAIIILPKLLKRK